MSHRICAICGKKPKRSATRSHSNIKTLTRQRVNIQTVNGRMLCTRCLKKERAVKSN
ncbi:MAG: bL28 family ribosomal protein [Patescibacteria group bacterium]